MNARHLLLLGGRGLLGRQVAWAAKHQGWNVTVVAKGPRHEPGVLIAGNNDTLRGLLGREQWYGVIDFRAFDAAAVKVVLPCLDVSTAYVLVSSIYAYCHPKMHPERDLRYLSDTAALTPSGPYGEGKVRAEGEATGPSAPPDSYAVRLPYVFGPGDRTGRTEGFWRFAQCQELADGLDKEVGLVSAATVATRLVRLLHVRPHGRYTLNCDGGRSWTIGEHLAAAKTAFAAQRDDAVTTAQLPFATGRHYSVDSTAFHELVGLAPEEDVEEEWRHVAATW